MASGAGKAPEDQSKAKVFISYSRKDMAFADRLEAALKARGFEPLMDRTDILAFEEWWKRVEALIARADSVVFVLSPDAVRPGTVALKEIAFAASLNKRLAPIVFRPVEDNAVPEALSKLNFIFFNDPVRFEQSADQLAGALNTDISWIRQHTEFGEQARRWALAEGPSGLLLRSPVLEQAERWIAARPRGAPAPTEETQTFIRRSRQGATRRRNILTGSLAAGLVLALGLAALAYWQRGIAIEQERVAQQQRRIADEQRKLAEEQRDVAEKRRITTLAELATSERLRGNWDVAMRLATHASRLALALNRQGAEISAARTALAVALKESDWRLIMSSHEAAVRSVSFSPDGTRIVTASEDNTARIWDTATAKEIAVLRGHSAAVLSGAFSPDGSRIVTASWDKSARLWDAASGKEIAVLRGHQDGVYSAAFSSDGSRVVTASNDRTARIWNAATAELIAVLRGHENAVTCAAFNPDGARIVTASRDATARIWDTATAKETVVLRDTYDDLDLNLGYPLFSAGFSPNGSRIVTASMDRSAHIWDAVTGKKLWSLRGHQGSVLSAVYSPDGSRIVTTSTDGTARIWDVSRGQGEEHSAWS